MNNTINIQVQLSGIRPLMFDRYAGDNNTQLNPTEKMYLDEKQRLIIPAINIMSLLAAENTKSVSKQFFGKQGRTISLGISSYTLISPFEIPVLGKNGEIVFKGTFDSEITLHKSVARLAKGVPNPKIRPVLALPWTLKFDIEYQENKYCTLENLRQAITLGGTLGLGTFRPFFGRFELAGWDIK